MLSTDSSADVVHPMFLETLDFIKVPSSTSAPPRRDYSNNCRNVGRWKTWRWRGSNEEESIVRSIASINIEHQSGLTSAQGSEAYHFSIPRLDSIFPGQSNTPRPLQHLCIFRLFTKTKYALENNTHFLGRLDGHEYVIPLP